MKDYVKDLYKKLSENIGETPETFHFDYFKLEGGELYYRGKRKPVTYGEGKLKLAKEIKKILGKRGLRNLGLFEEKVTDREAVMLNKVKEELPSESDITKADDIELQEITESTVKSTEDLITQFEGEETLPMRELLGLNKQLRSLRGSLKVEVAKNVQLEERIKKEHRKLEEFQEYPGVYDDEMREDITKQIDKLNDELVTRQESIDLLKGRLKNQITSFYKKITAVLDKVISLAEKIKCCLESKALLLLPYSRLSGWLLGYSLKH